MPVRDCTGVPYDRIWARMYQRHPQRRRSPRRIPASRRALSMSSLVRPFTAPEIFEFGPIDPCHPDSELLLEPHVG
jgi:hypothetical protein